LDILDVLGRERDLFCVVMATIFFAKALVLEGVDMGVMYLLSWYELVESVGGIQGSPKESAEIKGGRGNGSDGFLGDLELLPNMMQYDD
jgi:hypothetical protein